MLFTNATTSRATIKPGDNGTITINNATATRYYVRVRGYNSDSMNNYVYSAFSTTVRAKK